MNVLTRPSNNESKTETEYIQTKRYFVALNVTVMDAFISSNVCRRLQRNLTKI